MIQQSDWDVYMSGALSSITKEQYEYATKEIYDSVENVCNEIKIKCYCPHKSSTTPTKGIPHSKVWSIDYEKVVRSKAIIAYIGIPAFGVGMEIEMARTANKPVVLLCEKETQESLSRIVLGNPAVVDIVLFNKPEEFRDPLKQVLVKIFSLQNLEDLALEEGMTVKEHRELKQSFLQSYMETLEGSAYHHLRMGIKTKEEWKEDWKKIGRPTRGQATLE